MNKFSPWLFIIIALMWLLPMVNVDTAPWGDWIATIALALVGILELMNK